MWDEHDTQLNKEGTVCTATGCRCSMQDEIIIQTFQEEMERVDSASARFPDRHVQKLVMGFKGGERLEEVWGSMKRMWRTISVVVMRKNIGWIELIHGISIAKNGHFVVWKRTINRERDIYEKWIDRTDWMWNVSFSTGQSGWLTELFSDSERIEMVFSLNYISERFIMKRRFECVVETATVRETFRP